MDIVPANRLVLRSTVLLGTALAVVGWSGCSSVAPSRTATGAGTGAVLGGVGGAVVGNNSGLGTGTGAAIGVGAGALIGGIVGMVQDAKDRKEQDRLAQERAYQQEIPKLEHQSVRLEWGHSSDQQVLGRQFDLQQSEQEYQQGIL